MLYARATALMLDPGYAASAITCRFNSFDQDQRPVVTRTSVLTKRSFAIILRTHCDYHKALPNHRKATLTERKQKIRTSAQYHGSSPWIWSPGRSAILDDAGRQELQPPAAATLQVSPSSPSVFPALTRLCLPRRFPRDQRYQGRSGNVRCSPLPGRCGVLFSLW